MKEESELSRTVRRAIDSYFRDLDGQKPHAIYEMVIHCVERPMLESVLERADGNQSRAAEILGLNRNTLRKKMKEHGLNGSRS
jgi:Fis family transcriptional regulator